MRVPILIIQAGADPLVPPDEGDELARIARHGGCPEARAVTIPGADHSFTGKDAELVSTSAGWLGRLAG